MGRNDPFFSCEGIASFNITFAAKNFDIVAVVSLNPPSGKRQILVPRYDKKVQVLTHPFPQIPWPNPRIPASPAC